MVLCMAVARQYLCQNLKATDAAVRNAMTFAQDSSWLQSRQNQQKIILLCVRSAQDSFLVGLLYGGVLSLYVPQRRPHVFNLQP